MTNLCRRRPEHLKSSGRLDSMVSDKKLSRDARRGLEDSDVLNDTLNMFLTSSLNVELVYTILTGIRRLAEEPESAETKKEQNRTRISMEHIKIRNFECWEDVHQQQFLNDPNMPFDTKIDKILSKNVEDTNELIIDKKVSIDGHFEEQFATLRKKDGLKTDTLLSSLDPDRNQSNVFKAGEASGASGSFFFFSYDKQFIVKTMTSTEMDFFCKKVACSYFKHLMKHPTSLLARIYGVYTVKI